MSPSTWTKLRSWGTPGPMAAVLLLGCAEDDADGPAWAEPATIITTGGHNEAANVRSWAFFFCMCPQIAVGRRKVAPRCSSASAVNAAGSVPFLGKARSG